MRICVLNRFIYNLSKNDEGWFTLNGMKTSFLNTIIHFIKIYEKDKIDK